MSAPDTNVERQEKRHRPSLWGIKAAMGFGAIMFVVIFLFSVSDSPVPSAESLLNDGESPHRAADEDDTQLDPYKPGTQGS